MSPESPSRFRQGEIVVDAEGHHFQITAAGLKYIFAIDEQGKRRMLPVGSVSRIPEPAPPPAPKPPATKAPSTPAQERLAAELRKRWAL